MTEKPNLEDLLGVFLEKIEGIEEKSLVQMYLLNESNLSSDARVRAAEIIKNILDNFPEIAELYKSSFDYRKSEDKSALLTAVSDAKTRLERIESAYRAWGDRIAETGEVYHECCQLTMGEYMGAIEGELAQISTSLSEVLDIELDLDDGDISSLKERINMLKENTAEYEKEQRRLKNNYNRNKFDPASNQWHNLKKMFATKSVSGFMRHIGPYDEPLEK